MKDILVALPDTVDPNQPRLSVENLSFRRGLRWSLESVSFTLHTGVLGVLGGNGAGKTTLLRLLARELRPAAGSITLARAGEQGRIPLGYLPQELDLPGSMRLQDAVEYCAWLQGASRSHDRGAAALIDSLSLTGVAKRRLSKLSGGTRRRAAIASALAAYPTVAVLDEPTAGVDAAHRLEVLDVIQERARDTAVVMTSHIADDIDRLCTNILVLSDGHVVFSGGRDEAIALVGTRDFREAVDRLATEIREPLR